METTTKERAQTESVKIPTAVLDQVREIAKREGRLISRELEEIILAGLQLRAIGARRPK